MIYIVNSFSPSMLPKLPLDVEFTNVQVSEFCGATDKAVNAVGHSGTVELINSLCGSRLKVNRINMSANVGDEIYIVTLNYRLEEGRVLDSQEIIKMYEEGKVRFIRAKVYGGVLADLTACENVCNEREYDVLAYRAKVGR